MQECSSKRIAPGVSKFDFGQPEESTPFQVLGPDPASGAFDIPPLYSAARSVKI